MACDFNLPIPAAPICWQPALTFFLSSRSLVFVITSSHAYVDFRERPECLGGHHVSGAENRMPQPETMFHGSAPRLAFQYMHLEPTSVQMSNDFLWVETQLLMKIEDV